MSCHSTEHNLKFHYTENLKSHIYNHVSIWITVTPKGTDTEFSEPLQWELYWKLNHKLQNKTTNQFVLYVKVTLQNNSATANFFKSLTSTIFLHLRLQQNSNRGRRKTEQHRQGEEIPNWKQKYIKSWNITSVTSLQGKLNSIAKNKTLQSALRNYEHRLSPHPSTCPSHSRQS
jgi:hypothetical protein